MYNHHGEAIGYITGLSWDTFTSNLMPEFSDGWYFNTAVTFIFPCFLGIFYGANNVVNLKRPNRSIPLGAFSAILTSLCLYTFVFCMLAAVADRNTLKNATLLYADVCVPTCR